MKQIPKREASLFSKTWSSLLDEALQLSDPASWFNFFSFPKCILLAPIRGGKRISKSRSQADVVHDRLVQWGNDGRNSLWHAVVARGARGRRAPEKPAEEKKSAEKSVDDKALEKRVTQLVKNGDTRKALQQFTAAPFAPKTEATFEALKALHPDALRHVPPAVSKPSSSPFFSDKVVREALSTFSPSSAAGLFGYRPWILQQCARAESFHFVATLARAVNVFAAGEAPEFLQPFMAGGVSIALAKPNRGVRPCALAIRCVGWWPSAFVLGARAKSPHISMERIMGLDARRESKRLRIPCEMP